MTAGSDPSVVRALLAARVTTLADVDPRVDGRLLVLSNATGTMQLSELSGDGPPVALTDLPEPVSGAHYVPGARRAVLELDAGGNERGQLFALALDRSTPVVGLDELDALTDDPAHGHHDAGISPDGRLLAYTSNRADGVDFDLYLCDLRDGTHRLLWRSGGWALPASGFSPDGGWVSVLVAGDRPLHDRLVVIDLDGAASVWETPGRASLFGPPAWVGPDRFLVSTDADGDRRAVVACDLAAAGGAREPIAGTGEHHDTGVVSSRDGSTALAIENRDGASVMRPIDLRARALGPALAMPVDGVAAPRLSAAGRTVYMTFTGPRLPGDVFAHDLAGGETRRLTRSACAVSADDLVTPELGAVASFDGEQIPYLVYRPPGASRDVAPPAVVFVHGGPESQSTRAFHPIVQALAAGGYGVVVPNVRGSTGYGRRYASLDDTTRRLDSVGDLAVVHGALAGLGFDPRRAALWGASYGGYMVLAGLAFQPRLWAAGVDIVGISNLVTFLENTSAYRRSHREREYGSLERDRAFLVEASPLTHVDAMRAPLFVIHGRNDPRVPVGEAEQLVAQLRRRGVRCELAIYEDEGHGLARLDNRLEAFPRAIAFLDAALRD